MFYTKENGQVCKERVERKMFGVSLSRKNDPELFAFLESKPNVSLYIKTVLYADYRAYMYRKETIMRCKARKEKHMKALMENKTIQETQD